MKTRFVATALALAVCFMGISVMAHAADAPKASTVTGKAVCKSETKDGKTTKECSITVATATGPDGKAVADLAGKSLKATGAKAGDIEKLNDKEVVAKGVISADKTSIEIESVMEKQAHHGKEKKEEKK